MSINTGLWTAVVGIVELSLVCPSGDITRGQLTVFSAGRSIPYRNPILARRVPHQLRLRQHSDGQPERPRVSSQGCEWASGVQQLRARDLPCSIEQRCVAWREERWYYPDKCYYHHRRQPGTNITCDEKTL